MGQESLRDVIRESASKFSNNNALAYVGQKEILYSELYQSVLLLSQKLQSLGIQKGDKVAILSSNSPNWGISYLSIVFAGAIVVPILTDFSKKEIKNILDHSEAKILFVSESLVSKVSESEFDFLKVVISIEKFTINKELSKNKNARFFDIPFLPLTDIYSQLPEINNNDLAAIIYTSGTTGLSKGVMLSHKNIVSNIYATDKIQKILSTERLLSVLPLSHTYECTLGFLMPLVYGGAVYYLEGMPTASILVPAMQKVKPTMMLTVPLIIEKIFKSKIKPQFSTGLFKHLYNINPTKKILCRIAGRKLKSTFGGEIRFFGIGGAMLEAETETFLRLANFPYAIGYGLTETSPLLAGCSPDKTLARSTGYCLPGQELKLVNVNPETGEGEIIAKGDNIMVGYYKNEELTKKSFTDNGWFKTGDLGFFDKNNMLFIKGRLKNMILGSNGENIYPEEIEAVLGRHNLVLEAIVYQFKGKLVAKVHLDYNALEKHYAYLIATAKFLQQDFEQYVSKILSDIQLFVNNEVSGFSKLSMVLEQPVPFEKTPTLKIKKYLYI
jgi:long-chain acyl-CoA synthetase